ncbi:ABC transporter ATP-binding protein [Streptomyces sp. Tu 2975]|uniref:ABC transporter ATP-binding protein n=1 Tax=Streptomyces sp. Tu 2975 TaxID=2676871 RepID=UPI001FC95222|nr:ABC transporter ATP-binding protein [Streptomyces sp. Tu 2975]
MAERGDELERAERMRDRRQRDEERRDQGQLAAKPEGEGRRENGRTAPVSGGDALLRGTVRRTWFTTAVLGLCSTAAAGCALAVPAVIGHALDLMLDRRPGAGPWLALSAVLLAGEVLLEAARVLLSQLANARATAWVRIRALTGLLGSPIGKADAYSSGDVAARLCVNAADSGAAPAALATIVSSLLAPAGALVALALIDPWTAAVFLAGVPLLLLLLRAFARHSSDSVGRYQRVQADIAARLAEALEGARTVAAAGTVGREARRVLAPLDELALHGRRMWTVHGRAVAHSGVLLPLLVTAVLAVGGVRVSQGALSVGELMAASRYAALAAGVGGVASPLGALVRARSAARRTAELADLEPMPHGGDVLPADGTGTLELRGVGVVRGGVPLLTDVTLKVPGGATAAVVGRSGSGKSSLAAVAGRLEDPDAGQVLLDGVPLSRVVRRDLRACVAYAFARPEFPGGTVAEAVAAGVPASGEQVRHAAALAHADDFVRLLPQGYETPLDQAPLSGGERQRLGLARAFVRRGRLTILDDATSSLDTATERQVELALSRASFTGTRLVVAHRVSTAARADLVIWLEAGRVRRVAPHDALWRDPDYRAVFTPGPVPEQSATPVPSTAGSPPSAPDPPAEAVRVPAREPTRATGAAPPSPTGCPPAAPVARRGREAGR